MHPKTVPRLLFASANDSTYERMSLQRPSICDQQQWVQMLTLQQNMMVEFARSLNSGPAPVTNMSRPHDPNRDGPRGEPYPLPGPQNIDPNLENAWVTTESEGLLERSSNEDSSEEETDTPPEGYEDLGKGGKLNAVNKAAKNKLAVSCIAFESCKHINTDTNDRPCS